jgi:hypothetical protein
MLQSYEDTSRNRCKSGWTFSMHYADELLSSNVCKNDLSGHLPIPSRGEIMTASAADLGAAARVRHESIALLITQKQEMVAALP